MVPSLANAGFNDGILSTLMRRGPSSVSTISVFRRTALPARSGWWQAARGTGAWTLVGCVVSPGFTYDSFVLAPPGFDVLS